MLLSLSQTVIYLPLTIQTIAQVMHIIFHEQLTVAAPELFLRESIRNINYKKYKTKNNLNISISQKTKIEIHKILQLHSMIFHILKLLHDFFIINPTSYIYFNVYNQTNIHPLISHLIDLFRIC